MLEPGKCFGDVARHGDINCMGGIIPSKRESHVQGAGPVDCNCVQGLQCLYKVLGMFTADIFDPEIVDTKSEGNGSCGMAEESMSVADRSVAICGKVRTCLCEFPP